MRVPLDILHELLAPHASFDENESALAILEASVKYLGGHITWVKNQRVNGPVRGVRSEWKRMRAGGGKATGDGGESKVQGSRS